MLNIPLNKSYNDNCAICIEEFDLHSVQLKCNHTFHSKCIIKYIEIEYKRQCKENFSIYYKHFTCPLCRTTISCIDITHITYSNYKEYMAIYKNLKKDIKQLQKQSYLFTMKFYIKKLFTNITPKEAYTYLIEDEKFLELISYKKQEIYETKKTMTIYQNLYYRKCICCHIII
jgi:hypothetical protein